MQRCRRARARLLLALLTAPVSCGLDPSIDDGPTRSTSEMIANGYEDTSDNAVVGLVVVNDHNRIVRTCTGSLIEPNLVLTAQHCLSSTDPFVNCSSSRFGALTDPLHVFVTNAPSMWLDSALWLSAREVMAPPGGPGVCGRDVALIMLAGALSAEVTPLGPRLDEFVHKSELFSAIGYGKAGATDAGVRRRRDGLQVKCVGYSCGTAEGSIDGREWVGGSGVCSGDSGGPAIDAHGHVIGVTSRGPTGCDNPVYGSISPHRDWLVSQVQRSAQVGKYEPSPAATTRHFGLQATSERWSSCAIAPPRSRPGGIFTVFALALSIRTGRRRNHDSGFFRNISVSHGSNGTSLS